MTARRPTLDPAAEAYTPPDQPLSPHCEAAKDLLMFMRNAGIRCDALEVGKDGIRILNLTDDYPRKREATQAKVRGGDPDDTRLYTD